MKALKSEAAKQTLDAMLKNSKNVFDTAINAAVNVDKTTIAAVGLAAGEALQRMDALAYTTAWEIETKAMLYHATLAACANEWRES